MPLYGKRNREVEKPLGCSVACGMRGDLRWVHSNLYLCLPLSGGTLQTMGTAQRGGVARRKHASPDKLQLVNKLVGVA
jgi:hypothetical protein